MAGGVDTLPDPPDAPEIRRRFSLYPLQWIGITLIAIIPLLALLGVFGERWATAQAESGALQVSVTYPTAFRYKMLNAIDVQVRNRGSTPIDTLTVALDTAYANRFSTVAAIPSFTGVYTVDLPAVAPGETRHVRIEIQAEEYWAHAGTLTISARGDTVAVPLRTLIFP